MTAPGSRATIGPAQFLARGKQPQTFPITPIAQCYITLHFISGLEKRGKETDEYGRKENENCARNGVSCMLYRVIYTG